MADQKKYTNRLVNSRVLVIGGSSGIGFTVAEACIEYGALVTIASSNPKRVQAAVDKIKNAYPSSTSNIKGLTVDLSKPNTLEQEIEKLLKETVQGFGGEKLDHVVFTAADSLAMMPLSSFSMEKILAAGQIRFFAPLLTAKYLPTYLHQSPKSSFTITTGGISEKPIPNWSVIGAYAGGHHAMVRNLALDLKPIRVNGVSPGVVDTELWQMDADKKQAFLKACAEKTMVGLPGQPEDVAMSFVTVMLDANMDAGMVRTDGGGLFM